MNRRRFLKAMGLGAAGLALPGCAFKGDSYAAEDQPNILFILVDDLGKEWISCYGGEEIKTPNIDALARHGLTFTNAYSMPQCTPTRVSLLTGQYPWRTGWVNHWDVPRWGVGYFVWKENLTFARILSDAGYRNAAAGKWQINDFRVTPDAMKLHGFDDWCMWTGGEGQNPPSNERYWDPYINTPEGSRTYKGGFGPDLFADFLIRFMTENRRRPMMLYFPMALTHTPFVHTPDEPKVTEKVDKHKAMVRHTDKVVGRLVTALDDLRIRDRTVIFFTTDNGTSRQMEARCNGRTIKGAKARKTEAGTCAPFIVNCPGLVPVGQVTDALTDFTDLFPTFAELGGADLPEGYELDGSSIAPLLLGRAKDSPRRWILAMGHDPARLENGRVRGKFDFASRVIRDKRYKVWINEQRKIYALYDLKDDPFEEKNILEEGHGPVLKKFQAILDEMPEKDHWPRYESRQPLPWNKF